MSVTLSLTAYFIFGSTGLYLFFLQISNSLSFGDPITDRLAVHWLDFL